MRALPLQLGGGLVKSASLGGKGHERGIEVGPLFGNCLAASFQLFPRGFDLPTVDVERGAVAGDLSEEAVNAALSLCQHGSLAGELAKCGGQFDVAGLQPTPIRYEGLSPTFDLVAISQGGRS